MNYLAVLEKIESGQLNVPQAIKEIERGTKLKKQSACKIKLLVTHRGKKILLPAVSLKFVTPFLKLCAPFITFEQGESTNPLTKEEKSQILRHLKEIVELMADYPPIEVFRLQSEEIQVRIITQ
ncbi:MAG: hypothetical protein HFE54_01255 [Turicibacter sp.]|uniref:Uncharacterized protein n=1 Tax=Turicibacter faecis TaxID=2963365 RepID=A0ABN6ZC76_9FIRM|nr:MULTISPECIES: hypothetical protein [unclassified Turicibacter]MCI8701553.1 hypothetical protein [Turicibacter sp.]BEH91295.1 hypothetical protein T23_13970 [Turicibacter sp. TC023]MCI9350549.1 hypothetical protein [Turicibacter sp.]MCU7203933.1 hypothetical protein [Turicibacter sp. TA25]NCE77577.1 hypothetical protein [Turicibacter sp. TS3]